VYPILEELVYQFFIEADDYDPDVDGFIALVEPKDISKPLTDIWPETETTLADVMWEGFTQQDDYHLGIYLANNQYGIIFIIRDHDLTPELREVVENS
jgi:hypothetical protein